MAKRTCGQSPGVSRFLRATHRPPRFDAAVDDPDDQPFRYPGAAPKRFIVQDVPEPQCNLPRGLTLLAQLPNPYVTETYWLVVVL